MKSLALIITAMCVALPTGAAAQTPARDNARPAGGTAVIRGRVIDATTGSPMRGVAISAAAGSETRAGLTDGTGRFEIRSLQPGRYRVTAGTQGYLRLEFGQTRPAQAGRVVVLADSQTAEDVNFSLPRAASIAGMVRDTNGDPMANVQVRALRPVYREGRKVLNADVIVFTNDLGAYRLFGLLPGSFYLSVLAPTPSGPNGPVENTGAGLAPTYFPSTSSITDAERVVVKLGETTSGIDVTVTAVNNGAVRGRVLDEGGQPLAAPRVSIAQVGPGLLYNMGAPLQPDGSFSLPNLAPGGYELRATGTGAAPERTPLIAVGRVTVTAAMTTDVTLTATKLSTGSGRLLFDSASAATPAVTGVQLALDAGMVPGAVPYQARMSGTTNPIRIQPDRTFTVQAQPGRNGLVVNGLPRGWYLHAVRINGVDQPDGIDFPIGGKVDNIDIELTDRPSEIVGTAQTANGQAVADYAVIVFARDVARRTGLTRYFATTRAEADGTFKVLGLPAGDYLAVALEYADSEVAGDPDFLAPLANRATTLTLGDGQRLPLTLTLTP